MNILEIFGGWKDVEKYAAGKVIFREKDPAEAMYIVLSGEVALSLHDEPLGLEGEGGLIGEMAMFPSSVLNCTATATNAVHLARLDRRQFKKIVDKNPEFSMHAMAVLANRLRAVDHYITKHIS